MRLAGDSILIVRCHGTSPGVPGISQLQWCANATAAGENSTLYDFLYVDQHDFEKHKPGTLADLATSFTEYK